METGAAPHPTAVTAPNISALQDRKPGISAVIISCDEADVIEPCLQSVKGWVDEIVVVDMHSTDGTREIARRYTDHIVDHDRLTYADPARNFALAQATCDWILMLDPDERVPESLARELRRIATEGNVDVVDIPRQQIIFGALVHSPGAVDTAQTRFFRQGAITWPPEVHGRPDISHLRHRALVARSPEDALLHDTWRSGAGVLDRIMRYSPRDVENLQAAGGTFSPGRMARTVGDELMIRLIHQRAYEDGVPGLLLAFYFAFYKMNIYAQLWEAEGRPNRFDAGLRRWGKRVRGPAWFAYRIVRRFFLPK